MYSNKKCIVIKKYMEYIKTWNIGNKLSAKRILNKLSAKITFSN